MILISNEIEERDSEGKAHFQTSTNDSSVDGNYTRMTEKEIEEFADRLWEKYSKGLVYMSK